VLASLNLSGIGNPGWTLPNAANLIMAQHLAISTFEAAGVGPQYHRNLNKWNDRKRKNGQIEPRDIKVRRETITQTDIEGDEEDQRTSRLGRLARPISLPHTVPQIQDPRSHPLYLRSSLSQVYMSVE